MLSSEGPTADGAADLRGSGDAVAAPAGDVAEFELFFRANCRDLARLAARLTGHVGDADDVTAQAFSQAWQDWDQLKVAQHPVAVLRALVVDLAAQRVRRSARERRGLALSSPTVRRSEYGTEASPRIDLGTALLVLSTRRRACVVLRHFGELSEDEVAETLGLSVAAVRSHTSRGLAQLGTLLSEPERRSF